MSRTWQSTGIILAGTMATLALMFQVSSDGLERALVTSLFGAGVVFVLALWIAFVQREARLQKALIDRMRLLEDELGFHRQSTLRDASSHRKTDSGALDDLFGRITIDQTGVLKVTGRVVALGWLAVVAWRWIAYLT